MIYAVRKEPNTVIPKSVALETTQAISAVVTKALDDSDVIFAVLGEGLTVNQRDALKRSMPEGVHSMVVKNTLLKWALKDYPNLEPAGEVAKQGNIWFFVKFEDLREAVDAHKEWLKESGVVTKTYQIKGGAMDGKFLDGPGVLATSKLPTKQELIAKVASLLKEVPTKLGRGINAVPSKLAYGVKALDAERLARAVKAVKEKMED
jgi:large subunit ribosomal protein L10